MLVNISVYKTSSFAQEAKGSNKNIMDMGLCCLWWIFGHFSEEEIARTTRVTSVWHTPLCHSDWKSASGRYAGLWRSALGRTLISSPDSHIDLADNSIATYCGRKGGLL